MILTIYDFLQVIGGAMTYRTFAAILNDRRIPSARGGKWHAITVWRVIRRHRKLVESSQPPRPSGQRSPLEA